MLAGPFTHREHVPVSPVALRITEGKRSFPLLGICPKRHDVKFGRASIDGLRRQEHLEVFEAAIGSFEFFEDLRELFFVREKVVNGLRPRNGRAFEDQYVAGWLDAREKG